MATLQKFKLLATQCTIAESPTRSPTTSPVFQLRRRKTLRMLLSRNTGRRLPRGEGSPDRKSLTAADSREESKGLISHTLKELFVSSPPPPLPPPPPLLEQNGKVMEEKISDYSEGFSFAINRGGSSVGRRGLTGSHRPVRAGFRYRLLRRAWQPVLVTIPE